MIELISASLRKSLGKKRREIDLESAKEIVRLYSDFKETDTSKIFPNTEFLYKEYTVYQPLQRTGKLDMQQIEKLEASDLFTNNTSICNQSEFDALAEMNRHDREKDFEAEKKYQKYLQGKKYVDEVLSILKNIQLMNCVKIMQPLKRK